jgi:transcriptional regulator with XRE-family HTH domain
MMIDTARTNRVDTVSDTPRADPPHRALGELLRHHRELAGLSQEALAAQSGLSVRAIRYLERGSSRPYADTLRRLAVALALAPEGWTALVATARTTSPHPPIPVSTPIGETARDGPPPAAALFGRSRELGTLRDSMAASHAGRGSLVLISGEAGIGKTALAEVICREAAQQGALVLIGRCYDRAETPPYGPWLEAFGQCPPFPNCPSPPFIAQTTAESPGQFFAEVRTFLASAAAQRPLILLLDDLQWADPASLDLLRFVARALGSHRCLILATYRADEVTHYHPLSTLLPLLVREAQAARIVVPPLSSVALRALVHARYALRAVDEGRLADYLARRSDGNALFATELLHALEEVGTLVPGSARAGDFTQVNVPLLLRQVVASRVLRLGPTAEALLGVAAVIGQEVPLGIWTDVAGVVPEAVEAVAERALAVALLVEVRGGAGVGFAHALIREALYAEIPAMQRRQFHRRAGEALAAVASTDPDIVAYHFRQADDARARDWVARAAWRAYAAFAFTTARARFVTILPDAAGTERIHILLALAYLDKFLDRGVRYAEEAVTLAHAAGETVLAAVARMPLGAALCYCGDFAGALTQTAMAMRGLDAVPDEALPDLRRYPGLAFPRPLRESFWAYVLASTGRWHEALAQLGGTPARARARFGNREVNCELVLWYANILRGQPDAAREPAAAARASLVARGDYLAALVSHISAGSLLLLPFFLDDPEARQRHETEQAEMVRRAAADLGTVPPVISQCPWLIVTGAWVEARALWARRRDDALATGTMMTLPYVAAMARAQGATDEAWALVREGLPDGPLTTPGTTFFTTVDLYCLAVRLALDTGEHALAREWLDAHGSWLAWAGEAVRWGRADGELAWAEYHRATGNVGAALRHAEAALVEANAPRQPLALIVGHRVLGELLVATDCVAEARIQFATAMALADACDAPYERALTLLAGAELDAADGHTDRADQALVMVRAICTPLGATPILARVEELSGKDQPPGRAILGHE